MTIDASVAAQIVGGALVAGFIQGISGFAFGLIATSLWAWTIEPQLVVPTVIFGSFLGQMISVNSVRKDIRVARVSPFLIGGLLGVPVGAALLPLLNASVFRLSVGTVLVAYCSVVLLGMRLPTITRGGRAGDLLVGWAAGLMGGASALSGPPMTLWCAMRGWAKDEQRATYQSFFIVTQILTMVMYVATGVINRHSVQLFWLVGPPIMLASWVGSRWYKRLSDARFTRYLFLVLLLSGLTLVSTSTVKLLTAAPAA
jgi:uncharacterized membrane protein YfcA